MERREAERILRLSSSYTKKDVDAAYRSRAKECHPDLNGNPDDMLILNDAKAYMDRLFEGEPLDRSYTCKASGVKCATDAPKRPRSHTADVHHSTTPKPDPVVDEEAVRAAREERRRRAEERIRAAEKEDFARAATPFEEQPFRGDAEPFLDPELEDEESHIDPFKQFLDRFTDEDGFDEFPWRIFDVIFALVCLVIAAIVFVWSDSFAARYFVWSDSFAVKYYVCGLCALFAVVNAFTGIASSLVRLLFGVAVLCVSLVYACVKFIALMLGGLRKIRRKVMSKSDE